MEFDLEQPRAAYLVIAETIEDEIRAGRLRPGQRIPSAREIADEAGVGMRTAETALRLLREKGLTVAVVGKATYVAPDVEQRPTGEQPQDDESSRE
ncbi:GntR family transcriptional regulator [Actinomadura latina]|uniref:Winged helix-turn-helix transcriptional regulator n=1 Tax=Actinomadura latina TaxID=163603 RepID=A0A846ZBP6_9ACTN|nr:winged helix-turn-helix domain-containing protein [Actinomadura latina]NKZ08068.1 winged helix-turn-helix transcriptional regulator [Actinomadura latina]